MPKNYNRTHRIADALQRELANLIRKELNDPRVGFVTIVNVEVSRDLAYAKVFVTVFEDAKVKETLTVLNEASGFFRSLLARSMNLRVVPCLRFIFDDSVIRGQRLSSMIEKAISLE